MGEEEEEEDGDSEGGREADYSSMLSVHITEQVNLLCDYASCFARKSESWDLSECMAVLRCFFIYIVED